MKTRENIDQMSVNQVALENNDCNDNVCNKYRVYNRAFHANCFSCFVVQLFDDISRVYCLRRQFST